MLALVVCGHTLLYQKQQQQQQRSDGSSFFSFSVHTQVDLGTGEVGNQVVCGLRHVCAILAGGSVKVRCGVVWCDLRRPGAVVGFFSPVHVCRCSGCSSNSVSGAFVVMENHFNCRRVPPILAQHLLAQQYREWQPQFCQVCSGRINIYVL